MSIMSSAQAQRAERCSTPFDFSSVPPDFDPVAMPILAEHWFDSRPLAYIPRGRRLLRQLGPGARATARELRRRGLHLRVIEGGTP